MPVAGIGLPSSVAPVLGQCQTPLQIPAHGKRVNDVLLHGDARGQGVSGVAGQHRHARLQHRRTAIQLWRDEVNGRPRLRVPTIQCALMRVQPRIFR